eukprot:CAMPEP_0172175116 /NCGR_PEP_ID=MMETSP1050-20130122/14040_1 /TAXON_ID=233186 /ORGANISM="Cryptomonas curvata, Strain CCAP979/52" /LENGTH=1264 /DNA_ID=CAMNT_0012847165 /DNA_START=652 /DNA_END=4446 /DNA_ORIENTATION=+
MVVSFSKGDGASTAQWALLAVGPICFIAGLLITSHKRAQLMSTVRRLREDSLGPTQFGTHQPGPSIRYDRKRRDPFSEFFDSDSKLSRAFGSAHAAHACIRNLLHEKDERDIPLLTYLFERAMEEYPHSQDLLMLHLIFLRFVFRGTHPSTWKEKETKLSNSDLRLDLKYALYSVDRKALNYEAGIGLGQDSMSAINMMEVTRKLEHARKRHQECIALLRGLWKMAEKSKRESTLTMADNVLAAFAKTSETVSQTQKMYEDLLLKFPGSMSLHREYANFCDIILSDFDQSAKYQSGAEVLEAGDIGNHYDETRSIVKSVQSSTSSHRSMQRHFVDSWSHAVMLSQRRALLKLKWMVISLGFSLLVLSTVGFVIFDQYLLSTISEIRLSFLDRTMSYLQTGINSCITLRHMRLFNETDVSFNSQVLTAKSNLQSYSNIMRQMHTLNYISPPSQRVADFFLDESWTKKTVVGGESGYESVSANFWDLMNDFISSILASSQIPIAIIQNSDFSLSTMNVQQRAVSFIYDNFWELNSSLEDFYGVMLSEIGLLQYISDIVVYTLLSASLAQLCLISWAILQGVNSIFPSSQHSLVGGNFVHSLPSDVLQKLHNFYLTSERNLAMMQDETAAKEFLEQAEDRDGRSDDVQDNEDQVDVGLQESTGGIYSETTLSNGGVILDHIQGSGELHEQSGSESDRDPSDLCFLEEGGDGFGDYCGTVFCNLEKNVCQNLAELVSYPPSAGSGSLDVVRTGTSKKVVPAAGDSSQRKLSPMEVDDKICEMGDSEAMTEGLLEQLVASGEESDSAFSNYSSEAAGMSESDQVSSRTSSRVSPGRVQDENHSDMSRNTSNLTQSYDSPSSEHSTGGVEQGGPVNGQMLMNQITSTSALRISKSDLVKSMHSVGQMFSSRLGKDNVQAAAAIASPDSQPRYPVQASNETSFNLLLACRSQAKLAWYFRVSAHRASLAVLIGLCCCVWLFPVRTFPAVINTANLIRGVRRSAGTILLSGYVVRELILADGFSRMSTSALYAQSAKCRDNLLLQVDAFRFGGYIDAEKNYIRMGADFIGASARDRYNAIMYQNGCPWRKDPSNCSTQYWQQAEEQGLYKFLLQYHSALSIVLANYRPDPTGPGFFESRFDYIITDQKRVEILSNDFAVAFILENQGQNAIDGLNMLVSVLNSEKIALLDQMHLEVRILFGVFMALVVVVFYGLLFRLAIGATGREIAKTRAFVEMLPVQALTRQDMEHVMRFFVPEGLDDEAGLGFGHTAA